MDKKPKRSREQEGLDLQQIAEEDEKKKTRKKKLNRRTCRGGKKGN